MTARVVVLAGPSGSGKSRLAQRLTLRLGLPVLRLDDFYRDGDDPALPRLSGGSDAGRVDWDDPGSWLLDEAVAALRTLCATGAVAAPVYDIAGNGRRGTHRVELAGAELVVAEGIFAPEVVGPCREAGVLAAAYCLRQRPVVTFWRRLVRDLREHRKSPPVLLRRGLTLMRGQREVIDHAVAAGCEPVSADQASSRITALLATGRR